MIERVRPWRKEPTGASRSEYTREELDLAAELGRRALRILSESDNVTYREAVDIAAAELGRL